ncbi:hypothetical protein EVG20_g10123 [Dentipellis fragilis]|uniref:F-box domain-containing protein n=1 Tax=Dentipellis fragilis TaxID=205917 RepID=A0A4Y9XSZ5_9AGAM|nr:hypothetical protein EVG20_g10123 [Dentipellis fragilis]
MKKARASSGVPNSLAPVSCASSDHSINSTDHAIRVLDDEAKKLHAQLTSVYTRRNNLVPIYRLPPEVLVHVFSELIPVDSPGLHNDEPKAPKLGWIAVTHVSRRWQEVALQHATLWTTVMDNLRMPWMLEMIARSKTLPLDMQMHVRHAHQVSIMTNYVPRLAHLSLHVDNASPDFSSSLLFEPVPILESCSLHIDGDYEFNLPVDLFANTTP